MAETAPLTCVACADSLLATAARTLLEHHAEMLPDLTGCTLLIPDPHGAPALRRALLEGAGELGYGALLGPAIHTLESWLQARIPIRDSILSPAAQELAIVEAVREARHLFDGADPWVVAGELLELFGELTLANAAPTDFATFEQRLARAYGISGNVPAPFGAEARMVHGLWRAWHEQLEALRQTDTAQAHVLRLAQSLESLAPDEHLWLIGFTDLNAAEADWLRTLLERGQARLFCFGEPSDDAGGPGALLGRLAYRLGQNRPGATGIRTDVSRFLDAVFDVNTAPLAERAAGFSSEFRSDPVNGAIATFAADSAEQEARAVALRVRQWLIEGHQPIGILTEDRRLARRIRALLERAGLALEDAGGWALSTTSAAATLERWLETLEEDFAHGSLLDTLKSPFTQLFDERDHHLRIVRRLEQDVIVHENIARGLHRYRTHVALRAARLAAWNSEIRRDVDRLLNRLDQAAQPLRPFLRGTHTAAAFIPALRASLTTLGIKTAFERDPAGQRILQELEALEHAGNQQRVTLTWPEFRGWLGGALERYTFQPQTAASAVQLMTLKQSALQRFAGVVIAGCAAAQVPGSGGGHAFFNDAVRAELGLQTWHDRYLTAFYHLRRALECAPRILLTRRREDNGEPVQPSPWLELVETFHTLAYGQTLADATLLDLVNTPGNEPVIDSAPLPMPVSPNPAPVLPTILLPAHWSAASYQRLMDCPYRFFAADGLRLKAREEIREKLEKADYGEYVHRILNAFHTGEPSLPGPFGQPLSDTNIAQAARLLETISRKVFAEAVNANFEARSWLKRWLVAIPAYLEWQRARETDWRVQSTEQRLERAWPDGTSLVGRADRIDAGKEGLAILDYKTGAVPGLAEVESGEAVQLPSYALLKEGGVTQTLYVRIHQDRVDSRVGLQGSALDTLVSGNDTRLRTLNAALARFQPLPAWGDHKVCGYCDFDGLCRRQAWEDAHD